MDKTVSTDTLLLAAVQMARQAGAIQLSHFRSGHLDVHTKAGEADIVTKADRESERVILDAIHSQFPGHSVLSEESGSESHGSGYRWVVDPLDGTTNYTAGLPIFSVSIAVQLHGETIVGVVYAPRLDEMFTAVRGEGAMLNGRPIRVRDNGLVGRAVVSTGFPIDKDVNPDNNLDNVARVLPLVRGLRRLGSAAVDLSYVAAGVLDAYWESNLHEWDVAAGLLLVEEAGGTVSRFRDDRLVSVLAASPAIHAALAPLIR